MCLHFKHKNLNTARCCQLSFVLLGQERFSVPHRMLCLLNKMISLILSSGSNDQKLQIGEISVQYGLSMHSCNIRFWESIVATSL